MLAKNMEKEPRQESPKTLRNVEVQKFITFREIQAEDLPLIEKLASFSKDLLIGELHNLFLLDKERSGAMLEGLAERSRDQTRTKLFETMLQFYNKYGWLISHNLVRVLERI
ncbi:MAG: hypothetical protein A3D67_03255 [Candidatus Lloydbacteria bacterium RIFCSPHIGHO2_02_FULL_51_22]|uniref:Uncharacterized protein n=3 Tax=Candidatus Lloydiibacteriota TaxID=1817910 RepID=A0A1G2DBP0_9BACT|nr:MAG: hypothetical protein A3D67_03255 [Candidatus Lloydbacteria bacterium RIFCSPHIGHO2_02_FULL_51_22]OGZ15690.1 MAG: hypothetical protein A3J08_01405 [Candidatus Lloydbacteria bacterium RIFCSPLOWO2_02_FULL_51_11]OGZ15920.1 MAG: hypothetical protein A3G11_02400 [Candidatus Lloydbacteria bacterium RIFCSPLOWO2_12_FULL_51_9]